MDRIIKLNSRQGNFNQSGKNLVDFVIPRDNVYNLKDSYIVVNVSIPTTETNPDSAGVPPQQYSGGDGIHNIDIALQDNHIYPPVCLVRNAFMDAQNVGKIHDLRNIDQLNAIKYGIEKDYADKKDALSGLSTPKSTEGLGQSQFREFIKYGTDTSTNLDKDIRINLSDIFDVCNTPAYDAGKYGDTNIHLEMNFNKIIRQSVNEDATNPAGGDNYWDATNGHSVVGGHTYTGAGTDNVGSDIPLVMAETFSRCNFEVKSPWYVGQKVNYIGEVPAGSAPAGAVDVERKIVGINWVLDGNGDEDGTIEITLDSMVVALTGGVMNIGTLKPVLPVNPDANKQVDINSCEMVLRVVENPSNVPASLSYIDYDTENDNGNNIANFRKNYQIEPNTQTIYVGFGDTINSNSGATNINNWRYSLDNVSMVNRPIEWYYPNHLDLINQAYLNKDKVIKCLSINNIVSNNGDESGADVNHLVNETAVLPCLLKSEQQLLNVEFNCSAGNGINQINLFKEFKNTI